MPGLSCWIWWFICLECIPWLIHVIYRCIFGISHAWLCIDEPLVTEGCSYEREYLNYYRITHNHRITYQSIVCRTWTSPVNNSITESWELMTKLFLVTSLFFIQESPWMKRAFFTLWFSTPFLSFHCLLAPEWLSSNSYSEQTVIIFLILESLTANRVHKIPGSSPSCIWKAFVRHFGVGSLVFELQKDLVW